MAMGSLVDGLFWVDAGSSIPLTEA
jgi:hypothetical protein